MVGGATLAWDGPGFYVASAGSTAVETIYYAVQDTRALAHGQKMLDQSLRFLNGRTSATYSQIALNTVGAFNLIRASDPPQIAEGSVNDIDMYSLGHYRLWPHFWCAEESSHVELGISNSSEFDTAFLTSASYTHTGFWVGSERFLPEGEALDLVNGEQDTAVIPFKMEDNGLSPDTNSPVDLLVLGATETGIYPVANLQTNWTPTRIETLTGSIARPPAGYSAVEAGDAPTLPYPLSSVVVNLPDSTDYQVVIGVVNPFTLTVEAAITQTIPAAFTLVDAGGGSIVGDELVWTAVISPGAGLEIRALLDWQANPGTTITMPGAELAFQDPDTGQGDTYTTSAETVQAAWPLDVQAHIPPSWESKATTTIPVTLTNVTNSVVAQGVFTATIGTPHGVELWSTALPINVAPGSTQNLQLFANVDYEGYAVIRGEILLGDVYRREFLEIVAFTGNDVYLSIVVRP